MNKENIVFPQKYLTQFKYAKKLNKILEPSLDILADLLDIDLNNLLVVVAPIPEKRNPPFKGFYYMEYNLCHMEVRSHPKTFLYTLSHEMVHAKQHQSGIMEVKSDLTKYWDGKEIKVIKNHGREYHEQPWEIEAYERETELAEKVIKTLRKEKLL